MTRAADSMPAARRPHTGRRRNDAVRQAILDATVSLFSGSQRQVPTMRSIAAEAGVGKQTIYRWWPTKTALIVEAMAERASRRPAPDDRGSLVEDLEAFLAATFVTAAEPWAGHTMRVIIGEASENPLALTALIAYTDARRSIMNDVFERARERGELDENVDVAALIDQAFGFLWLRMIVGDAPLGLDEARHLATGLAAQAEAEAARHDGDG